MTARLRQPITRAERDALCDMARSGIKPRELARLSRRPNGTANKLLGCSGGRMSRWSLMADARIEARITPETRPQETLLVTSK